MTRNHDLKRIIELYIKAYNTFEIEGILVANFPNGPKKNSIERSS